eukprot:TRINITY_DN34002_c0_g1_i1.p1 TRINITY_DN34002_c0_g1~~TRINITY_DN34002_c0_g1_i1.p1  ORF type:complete len:883 (+),score=127.53 TRINITY_DN34002_c0_g1_i1:41-2650(+)
MREQRFHRFALCTLSMVSLQARVHASVQSDPPLGGFAQERRQSSSSCPKTEFVDPDTPSEACIGKVDSAGNPLELVFSDEFDIPGRTFADGHDPVWTAITGFPSSNDQKNAYADSSAHATTSNGNLWLRISNTPSSLELFNATSGKMETLERPYTSAMMQTWNKFCMTGGVVEISAKFPGQANQPGLWPAFWLLGNMGRATIEASLNNVWPYSYSQCPADNNASNDANQDPRKQQRINKCMGSNWTERFGLNPNQGRGALEIDILEVLPGDHVSNYRKDKVETGQCEPQLETLYSKLDQPRPYLLNTLQVGPGIPFLADQRPDAPPIRNTSCMPKWGKQWYQELRPENLEVYGDQSTINYDNFGRYIVNKDHWTDVKIQTDAIGATTSLTPDAFDNHHVYRFEWSTEGDGKLTFWMDGKMLYRLDGSILTKDMDITRDGKPVGTMLPRSIPLEPLYFLLNIDVSQSWGWDIVDSKCPGRKCDCCLDCSKAECLVCMIEKGSGTEWLHLFCRTLPATFEIDYIRLYQTEEERKPHRSGCSPEVAPTQGWIDSHRRYFVTPNYDAPLQPVYAGGARCQAETNCGSNHNGGSCVKGRCQCREGWTGPSCLARLAGDALACRPLEADLVGGGPCKANLSEHDVADYCGKGRCETVFKKWDAPFQKSFIAGEPGRWKPAGNGGGRCVCEYGWGGPYCNIQKEEPSHLDRCVPDASQSSPQLELLIETLCSGWIHQPQSARNPTLARACREVSWQPPGSSAGGEFSRCGAWPRATRVVRAVMNDTGMCCSRLDEQGRKACFEDAHRFDALMLVAACSLLLMAVLGCLRQASLRGGLWSKEEPPARTYSELEKNGVGFCGADSDTDEENGQSSDSG